MALDQAITTFETRLEGFNVPKPDQLANLDAAWYERRATAIGLSFLRALRVAGVESPASCERFYRAASATLKQTEPLEEPANEQ